MPARPLALQVDPSFDLFRRLDPREIPPSIGQIFGEPRLLAVVAASASAAEAAAWRTLALGWRTDAHAVEVVTDAEVRRPGSCRRIARSGCSAGKPLWRRATSAVDGRRRRRSGGRCRRRGASTASPCAFAGHTSVVVVRHPASAERAIGWITVDPALLAALPGLGRKLPHYGKYSYLGFDGTEPTNKVKGQWATTDSPLRLDLRSAAERTPQSPPLPALVLARRAALAELPPAPSAPSPPSALSRRRRRPHSPRRRRGPRRRHNRRRRLRSPCASPRRSARSISKWTPCGRRCRRRTSCATVDAGRYDGGRFHRTVRPDTETRQDVAIEVIQGGVAPKREKDDFPPIALERTTVTGLRHRDGTLSMARAEPDTATSDFFICIGDQPLLDFGGASNPDGQGFAAFGRVVRGMEIVRQIQAAPAQGQALTPPVQILTARRLP